MLLPGKAGKKGGPVTPSVKNGEASPSRDAEADNSEDSDASSDDGKQIAKVLKTLAFPEVETGSFNPDMCNKVSKCISKRLSKLEVQLKSFPENPSELQTKSGSWRLLEHYLQLKVCRFAFPDDDAGSRFFSLIPF